MELRIAFIFIAVACIMALGLALHYKRKCENLEEALYHSTRIIMSIKENQQADAPKEYENVLNLLFAVNDFERIGNNLINKIKTSNNNKEIQEIQIATVVSTIEAFIADIQTREKA